MLFVASVVLIMPLGTARADYTTDIRRAQAALANGDWEQARDAAKAAFAQARTGDGHVQAARLVAKSYHQVGAYTRAEFWLRRALMHASSAGIVTALSQEIAQVRNQNPAELQLQFSIAPNGNINNGYPGDRVMIWGRPFVLSPTARALSGIEVFAGAGLSYRIGQTDRSETRLGMSGYTHNFTLSPQSRKEAPGVDAADFARSGVDMSFAHRVRHAGSPGVTTYCGWAGQSWYGGSLFTTRTGALIRQDFDLSPRTRWHLLGGAEVQKIHQGTASHAKALSLAGGLTHLDAHTARLDLTIAARVTLSPSPSFANRYLGLTGRYRLARQSNGIKWAVLGSFGLRHYDISPCGPQPRLDRTVSLGGEAIFPSAAVFGLSPVARLEYVQTTSNVQLYDRRGLTMRFGWRSDF